MHEDRVGLGVVAIPDEGPQGGDVGRRGIDVAEGVEELGVALDGDGALDLGAAAHVGRGRSSVTGVDEHGLAVGDLASRLAVAAQLEPSLVEAVLSHHDDVALGPVACAVGLRHDVDEVTTEIDPTTAAVG